MERNDVYIADRIAAHIYVDQHNRVILEQYCQDEADMIVLVLREAGHVGNALTKVANAATAKSEAK